MNIKILALVPALVIAANSYASVSFSVDGTTTTSSTAWAGTPALGLNAPNGGSSIDGNVMDGIFFKPTSGFTLGSFEFYAGNGGAGADSEGTYDLSLYNLGSSYTLPASNPLYTFTGSEPDLFSAGLNVTTTGDAQFDVLTFAGSDQVSFSAGNTYLITFTAISGENLEIERGSSSTGTANPNFSTQELGLAATAPGSGVAVNQVPAGDRDAVGAFYALPVPEPSTFTFLGLSLVSGVLVMRRRNG